MKILLLCLITSLSFAQKVIYKLPMNIHTISKDTTSTIDTVYWGDSADTVSFYFNKEYHDFVHITKSSIKTFPKEKRYMMKLWFAKLAGYTVKTKTSDQEAHLMYSYKYDELSLLVITKTSTEPLFINILPIESELPAYSMLLITHRGEKSQPAK